MEIRSLSKPVPDGETCSPETEQERDAVREQLRRLLASSVFVRSKSCSNLLTHIVNRTLGGDADGLKERTIGVEVFGRPPDYDTASDHAVRSAASEVRKRLAQYYTEPGRSGEIRIDVPQGSYVPRFSLPAAPPVLAVENRGDGDSAVSTQDRNLAIRQRAGRPRSRLVAIAVAAAAAVLLSIWAIGASRAHARGRGLYDFWRPVLQSPGAVLVCIGNWSESGRPSLPGIPHAADEDSAQPPSGAFRKVEKVFFADAVTLAKITGWLQENGKSYRILPHSKVAFADLQTNPVVLIGLLNNSWTASLGSRLRFTVERGDAPGVLILRDKRNPSRNDWSVDMSTPYNQPTHDYALIVRELDPQTGHIVVTVGGITDLGTIAAADFLMDPEQIRKVEAYNPDGWAHRNVAIVLSTEVIKGSPGSAKIVATDFW